jgi:hypothetical protein
MSDLGSLAQALYSHFLLRDIAAKVIPGLIAALTLSSYAFPGMSKFLNEFFTNSEDQPFIVLAAVLVALYGFGLMFGMLLQFLGWQSRRIIIHVREGSTLDLSMRGSTIRTVQFLTRAKGHGDLLRKRERLIVLKEMAGNYAVSFVVIIVTVLLGSFANRASPSSVDWNTVARLAFLALFSGVLMWQIHSLAAEQRAFELGVIRSRGLPQSDSS